MPTPKSRATRFVVHTAGVRIIFISMSGLSLRNLAADPRHDQHGDVMSRPSVRAEAQPTHTFTDAASRVTSPRKEHCGKHIDLTGSRVLRLWHEEVRGARSSDDGHERDPNR